MIVKEFYRLEMISIYMAITVYASIHPTRWWFQLRLELRLVASELVSQWLVRQFAPVCQYSGGGRTLSSPSSGASSGLVVSTAGELLLRRPSPPQ